MAPCPGAGIERRCTRIEEAQVVRGEDPLPLIAVREDVDAVLASDWLAHEVPLALLEAA